MSDNQKIRDELVARAKELAPKIAARRGQAGLFFSIARKLVPHGQLQTWPFRHGPDRHRKAAHLAQGLPCPARAKG